MTSEIDPTVRGANDPGDRPPYRIGPVPSLLKAIRPNQWPKNVLVFVAPAAASQLFHAHIFVRAVVAFFIFCFAASGHYLLNDVVDAEADRHHPRKRHRPIAAGLLSVRLATTVGMAMMVASLVVAWELAGWPMLVLVGSYLVISVAYTLRLKHEPVIELAAVASGFVLRAVGGGIGTHLPLSNWFLVVASFGALFIVTGKRVAEQRSLSENQRNHRPVLDEYTPSFLQSTLILTAGVTVTAYCLWAFERGGLAAQAGRHLVPVELTVVPVVLGMLYVLRLLDAGRGGAPEDLVFHDRFLQCMGVVWIALFAIGIYT